uniref:Uncharacterized protein n=3 Tax=Amphimedon queenslandica TaxID=400682 RepID=A0A1X7UDF1_AMPQE
MCSRRLGAQNVTKSYQYCSWWWTKLWMLYLEMLTRYIINSLFPLALLNVTPVYFQNDIPVKLFLEMKIGYKVLCKH